MQGNEPGLLAGIDAGEEAVGCAVRQRLSLRLEGLDSQYRPQDFTDPKTSPTPRLHRPQDFTDPKTSSCTMASAASPAAKLANTAPAAPRIPAVHPRGGLGGLETPVDEMAIGQVGNPPRRQGLCDQHVERLGHADISVTCRCARDSQSGLTSTPQPGPLGTSTLPPRTVSGLTSNPCSQG